MSNKTPMDFLFDAIASAPDAPALRMSGKELTYAQVLDEVRRFSGYFRRMGVNKGERVALYTDDDLEFTLSLFGLWGLGAICMPMNVTQKPEKLQQIEGIVTPDKGFYSKTFALECDRAFPMTVIETGDAEDKPELYRAAPEENAIIMFTSGTSGVPKAVPMTFWAIGHNAHETARFLKITPKDRILINTPPYFTSSIIHVLTMFAGGASIVIERGFLFGSGILGQIKDFDCTGFGGVPVHFNRLIANLEHVEVPGRFRFLMNSGDHLPIPIIKNVREALPQIQLYCMYGLTEVAGRLCMLDPTKVDEKSGSVGFPLPDMSVSVRGEEGDELKAGETGEVYVQGPCLMEGYLNNPKVNAEVMKPFGFATGDFGYKDAEGYLYLKGRKDDIFKVGGEKVSVKMIEDAIYGFEDFADFSVAPKYDEHMGNVSCVYYVLKEGKEFNRKSLVKRLKEHLPPTHMPTFFEEVDEIPRTASGKVLRKKAQ